MQMDPVLEEIWRFKDEHAARFGYDIQKLAQALKEEEKRGGRTVVSFPPRRIPAKPSSLERHGVQ